VWCGPCRLVEPPRGKSRLDGIERPPQVIVTVPPDSAVTGWHRSKARRSALTANGLPNVLIAASGSRAATIHDTPVIPSCRPGRLCSGIKRQQRGGRRCDCHHQTNGVDTTG